MLPQRVEKLQRQYAGQQVTVDARRPELARWAGTPGRVIAVNHNGHALVQFEGADRGWHDIELDHLKVAERPAAKPTEAPAAPSAPSPAAGPIAEDRLSRLELARREKEAAERSVES